MLAAQVLLHDTLDQLRLLVDCFQLDDDARSDVMSDDINVSVQACVQVIAQCCNALMEVRTVPYNKTLLNATNKQAKTTKKNVYLCPFVW
jgi:hypothetical protein